MATSDWIEVGRIVGPHGIKGEVRVYPNSDFPERFLEPGTRWLQSLQQPDPQPWDLIRGRFVQGKGLYVLQFRGVTDRDGADALRNHRLLVPASDRPHLEEGEFYVADLMGLKVLLQSDHTPIGTVTDIYEAGNDLLEISLLPTDGEPLSQPRTVLVPFVEAIVPTVNLAEGYIEINPPPGLLNLG